MAKTLPVKIGDTSYTVRTPSLLALDLMAEYGFDLVERAQVIPEPKKKGKEETASIRVPIPLGGGLSIVLAALLTDASGRDEVKRPKRIWTPAEVGDTMEVSQIAEAQEVVGTLVGDFIQTLYDGYAEGKKSGPPTSPGEDTGANAPS